MLLKIAMTELGVKEEAEATAHNPRILQYAQEAGFTWVNDDETPWCSIFVNWCAKEAGLSQSKKPDARSWLKIGKDQTNPKPGDVVVFWRGSPTGWQGHVGFFLGFSTDLKSVFTLGGNQGNSVSIAAYPSNTVLGFRSLSEETLNPLPNPTLKKGDQGQAVRQLQEALKLSGFDCGLLDGDYGMKTEAAIKALQATVPSLAVNGIYNAETQTALQSRLMQ